MQLSDLFEAPIANFSYMGSPTKSGSLRDDDIRAVQNPKWQVKVHKSFRFIHEEVNLTLINMARDAMMVRDSNGGQNRIHIPNVLNISQWSGSYRPVDFEHTFGFLPEQFRNRINITLISNEGDERVPLTPWMVAHRFMHALGNTTTDYARLNSEVSLEFDTFFRNVQKALEVVRYESGEYTLKVGSTYMASVEQNTEMFKKLATFASAQHGKIARPGEFIIELATQYFLTGKMYFNIDSFTMDDYDRNKIERHIGEACANLDKCFKKSVGQLIVF